MSTLGEYYGGYLVAAHGNSPDYTFDLPLAVPTGSGYAAVVLYRPTADSGPWQISGTSPGTFAVSAAAPALSFAVTAPTGSGSYAKGDPVTVTWSANSAVSDGEFGVFAVSPLGEYYGGYLAAAHGNSPDYTFDLPLAVPTGSGYAAVVLYRPTADSGPWQISGTSPGTFAVSAAAPALSFAVTAPTGSGSHRPRAPSCGHLAHQPRRERRPVRVFRPVSPVGAWYGGTIVDANGGVHYESSMPVNAPAGTGYRVVRLLSRHGPVAPGASPAARRAPVDVGAELRPSPSTTAPAGTTSLDQGADLAVTWHTNLAVNDGG